MELIENYNLLKEDPFKGGGMLRIVRLNARWSHRKREEGWN